MTCLLSALPTRRRGAAAGVDTTTGMESEGFGGARDRGGRFDNGRPPGVVRFGVLGGLFVSPTRIEDNRKNRRQKRIEDTREWTTLGWAGLELGGAGLRTEYNRI